MGKYLFEKIKNNSDFALAAGLAVLGIYIFYPGAMSGDSIEQWRQTLVPDQISNWFPPAMVYMWLLLNKITFGPQGMLIFQYLLYFLAVWGFGKLFIRTLSGRLFYTAGIGMFPPIFFLTGVIWKDVSLLVGIANAMVFLFVYEKTKKKTFLIVSLLFFLYGILVRHNGVVCAIPYAYYLATIRFNKGIKFRSLLVVVTVVTMTITFYAAALFVSNYKIKDVWKTHNFENAVFIWDLWGMSIEIGKNIVPPYVFNEKSKGLDVDVMRAHYKPDTNAVIYLMQYITLKRFKKDFPNTTFKKDFIKAVLEHPGAYLTVRARITWYMLGGKVPILPYLFEIIQLPNGHYLVPFTKDLSSRHVGALEFSRRIAQFFLQHTPVYKVWIYMALAVLQTLFFLFVADANQRNRQFLLILFIGLFYWLPYPIISPATDFRLSNLTVFCTILTLPFFIRQVVSRVFPLKNKGSQP